MSKILIKHIDEPDFGCEGAPDNKPVCDRVTFLDGESITVLEIPEKIVWETEIDEGMSISDELFERLNKSAVK